MTAFSAGFGLAFALFVAPGAQTAFLLQHGIRRQHIFILCALCTAADVLLIAVGVAGFHSLAATAPWVISVAKYGGAAFLFAYGGHAFYRAHTAAVSPPATAAADKSFAAAIATCLAFTFLNPHVYLDTVILLGSISTQYPGAELAFAIGASLASLTFFFALGFSARLATPLFQSARSWRILDLCIGVIMWAIAVSLLLA